MTTTKIVKSFSEKTSYEIENGTHTVSGASWGRMKEYIAIAVGLKGNERILGIVADDDGIQVKIDYKK